MSDPIKLRPEIKSALQELLGNKEVRESVVDAVVDSKRPPTWSRGSIAPYYRERFAKDMKAVLDVMEQDREDRMFYYADFPHQSKTSLHNRLLQSWRYLRDCMDTEDKKYARLREQIHISTEKGVGFRLSFDTDFTESGESNFASKATKVIPPKKIPLWKEKMEKWLEESVVGDPPFKQEGLALDDEAVHELKTTFVALANVLSKIDHKSIKLVKIDPLSLEEFK